jgi:hypothetical protein
MAIAVLYMMQILNEQQARLSEEEKKRITRTREQMTVIWREAGWRAVQDSSAYSQGRQRPRANKEEVTSENFPKAFDT